MLRGKGLAIGDRDLLIGAAAIARKLPLPTKNLKHFEGLKPYGLEVRIG